MSKPWPAVVDCIDRLGVDPSDSSAIDALTASLDATIALVIRNRTDLADANGQPVPQIGDDEWQGVVILACLDYRAANSPNGFTGFDGGLTGDSAERFRAQQLLRMARWVKPKVG